MEGHLDFNNVDKIIKEYLGIEEGNNTIDLKQLKKDIKKVCDKYKGQDVEYILEGDYICGRASGMTYNYNTKYPLAIEYEDIEFLDNINGIVVYKRKESNE